jgi:PEP-CTERM motif
MKILNFAKTGLAIAAFAAMGAMSSGAQAADAIIDCCFVPGVNELQDSDADRILRDGSLVTSGTFQTGDVVESLLRIDTVNSQDIQVAVGDINYQLIAYATLTITAITDTTGGSCDLGEQCIAITAPVVSVYELSSSTNLLGLDPDTAISTVTSTGTLVLTLGLVEPDDFWYIQFTRTATGEITDISGAAPGSPQAGLYVFGVSATSNPGNIPYDPNGIADGLFGDLHDFIGNGSGYALENGVNTGWLLSTNTTVLFNVVPEPGTLALLGLGLVATWFGGVRRKA